MDKNIHNKLGILAVIATLNILVVFVLNGLVMHRVNDIVKNSSHYYYNMTDLSKLPPESLYDIYNTFNNSCDTIVFVANENYADLYPAYKDGDTIAFMYFYHLEGRKGARPDSVIFDGLVGFFE